MEEVRSGSVSMRQFNMMLLVLFAATAMLLAIVGVYGVISLNVAQRTQEMGVRLALGAKREDVLRLVLGEGLRLALIGIAAGLVATFALTRVLQSFLYGVNPGDPLVLASMAALLGAAALLASYFPARRAMRVEPVVALRYE